MIADRKIKCCNCIVLYVGIKHTLETKVETLNKQRFTRKGIGKVMT